jgi:hypothetical protein
VSEQTPGKFPSNLPLAEAEGNSVILDLGSQRYALYAHLQPGSIKVRVGDNVKPGQMIGLVAGGDSATASGKTCNRRNVDLCRLPPVDHKKMREPTRSP